MVSRETGRVGQSNLPRCDGGGAAFEAARVDEGVGEEHDVGAHAVLVFQADDGLGVGFAEELEEGGVEAAFCGLFVLDERGELVVVADEDEFLGHADGAEADGEGDLRGFVDDAVVEDTSVEEGVVDGKAGRGYDWWFCPGPLELFQAVLRLGS